MKVTPMQLFPQNKRVAYIEIERGAFVDQRTEFTSA
jgi:hypothetical protein